MVKATRLRFADVGYGLRVSN